MRFPVFVLIGFVHIYIYVYICIFISKYEICTMVLHKDQISYIRCLMVLFKKLWRLNNVESKYTLWYVLNRFCKIHFSKESNKIWLNLSKHNVELYNLTEQHGYLTKVWKKVLQESSYPTKGRASDAHPETCYWRTNPPTNLDKPPAIFEFWESP